jgi:Fe2+ transport system protein B
MEDPLKQKKRKLLKRLNDTYIYRHGELIRKSDSVKIGQDAGGPVQSLGSNTRQDYIEKLKSRIDELEQQEVRNFAVHKPHIPKITEPIPVAKPHGKPKSRILPKLNRESSTKEILGKKEERTSKRDKNREEFNVKMKLIPCKICARKFQDDRITIHQEICTKSSRKRNVFDEKQMRLKGTEFASFTKKTF